MVASVAEHEGRLRTLRCMVSDSPYGITLHHCHGGSMMSLALELALPNPGMAQRNNPFLQIPLSAEYHIGNHGIDVIGVEVWEERFGSQRHLLEELSEIVGYNVFEAAQRWRKLHISKVFN